MVGVTWIRGGVVGVTWNRGEVVGVTVSLRTFLVPYGLFSQSHAFADKLFRSFVNALF